MSSSLHFVTQQNNNNKSGNESRTRERQREMKEKKSVEVVLETRLLRETIIGLVRVVAFSPSSWSFFVMCSGCLHLGGFPLVFVVVIIIAAC